LPSPSKSALDLTIGVGLGEPVGVDVGVLVAVAVAVGVRVGVLVGVLVAVAVGVLVCTGVLVAVAVGVLVGVLVAVAVGVLVGVFVGVRVGVLVAVLVGVLVGVDVGVLTGVEVAVGVGPPPLIVKFASEISKKILPTACILILAVVEDKLGIVTLWDPSLGVLSASTVGNVVPPSVDNVILTFAAFTGALAVFATFQVTVCVEPPANVTEVLGEVTTNGPLFASTDTVDEAVLMPPDRGWLSRATTWNVIVRAIDGKSSPTRHGADVERQVKVDGGRLALFRMYCSDGNVRVPLTVGR